MEMQLRSEVVRSEREKRAWTQEQLAELADLGLRTIQRIESTGSASIESAAALSSVFGVPVSALRASAEMAGSTASAVKILWSREGVALVVGVFAVQLFSPPNLIAQIPMTVLLVGAYVSGRSRYFIAKNRH